MQDTFPKQSLATFATALTGQIRPGRPYFSRVTACAAVSATSGEQQRLTSWSTSAPSWLFELADANSRFTTIDGVTVHHKNWVSHPGSHNCVNLVCIHGFGASLFSFEYVAPQLARLGAVSAFDIPGFGLTQRPTLRHLWRYSPLFTARVAVVLPTARGSAGQVLVAHSMGALAAVEAARGDGGVRALVLIAPAITRAWGGRIARSAGLVFASAFLLLTLVFAPLICGVLRLVVAPRRFWVGGIIASRARGASVPPAIVHGYWRPTRAPGWERGLLNFVRCMLLYRAGTAGSAVRGLARLARDIPVLVVHGSEDRIISVANSRALKTVVPEIELLEMPDVGHVLHEEKPEEFARIVERFLGSHGIGPIPASLAGAN